MRLLFSFATHLALFFALCFCVLWLLGKATRYYSGPVSDHFDGRRFFLPGMTDDRPAFATWRWSFTRKPARWPASVPVATGKPALRVPAAGDATDALRVTFLGHAALLIQTAGRNFLIDPIYSERASPVSFAGPKRVRVPGVAFADLPPIDVVIVTHNHYDHLDLATLERLWRRDRPRFVTPLGNDAILRRRLPSEAVVTTLDWQQRLDLGEGLALTCLPAQHWSARWTWDRNLALWGAFVLEAPGGPLYLAGDTGYNADLFRAAAGRGPFRFAALPIGAYLPRWFMKLAHMDPEEAVRSIADLRAAAAMPIHFGTFPLADEGMDEPVAGWQAALYQAGLAGARFPTLAVGESWDVPPLP